MDPNIPQQFADAVMDLFLGDSHDHTITEIAAKMGVGAWKVRQYIASCHGCPFGIKFSEDTRPSYSTDYPSMQTGSHKVALYGPTREALAAALKVARTVMKAHRETIEAIRNG